MFPFKFLYEDMQMKNVCLFCLTNRIQYENMKMKNVCQIKTNILHLLIFILNSVCQIKKTNILNLHIFI